MIDSKMFPAEVLKNVAQKENTTVKLLEKQIKKGEVVVLYNPKHKDVKAVSIGKNLKIKINANIGISPVNQDIDKELEKVRLCERYEVDTIMDLSLGEDIRSLRKRIINGTKIPIGTVPVYELFYYNQDIPIDLKDKFLKILEESGQDGVDFVVIHAGLLKRHLELVKSRVIKVTSRGGSLLMKWMEKFSKENFLYDYFDEILQVCKKYNMTISLGDGMRPATIIDETDEAQIEELKNIGKLVLRAREAGVQTIVEGPGHIPFHKIKLNVDLQKEYCHGAPFYVLGPLVTDIAPGYDHITAAIGATMAAYSGADFLCYVTPSEHLALPTLEDVRQGIIAFKIAAHAVDLTRGKDLERDLKMSEARCKLDWDSQKQYALDSDVFDKFRKNISKNLKACTMCGEFCALK